MLDNTKQGALGWGVHPNAEEQTQKNADLEL